MSSQTPIDTELEAVRAAILALDPNGIKTAQVIRDTFDQLYDGQRTGRYRVDQLHKTEKTHFGTLVEINLHREFGFEDGREMDYRIAGIDVDCKFSLTKGAWMIPPEAHDYICLLIWAEDSKEPKWSMGLVRIRAERLNAGGNRDKKSTLNGIGKESIIWLFNNAALPSNVLLQLDELTVNRIMTRNSGQKKINELFRSAVGRIVGRAVVATVAQQDDYMKRVRANGGARTALKPEGIVILGQYLSHAAVARSLALPEPGNGESLSIRLTPADSPGPGVAEISGQLWKIAQLNDPIVPVPDLPNV